MVVIPKHWQHLLSFGFMLAVTASPGNNSLEHMVCWIANLTLALFWYDLLIFNSSCNIYIMFQLNVSGNNLQKNEFSSFVNMAFYVLRLHVWCLSCAPCSTADNAVILNDLYFVRSTKQYMRQLSHTKIGIFFKQLHKPHSCMGTYIKSQSALNNELSNWIYNNVMDDKNLPVKCM